MMVYALAFGSPSGHAMVARRMGEKDEEAAAAPRLTVALELLFGIRCPSRGQCSPHCSGRWALPLGARAWGEFHAGDAEASVSVPAVPDRRHLPGRERRYYRVRVLWLANSINIVLDPYLVFGVGPFRRWAWWVRRWRPRSAQHRVLYQLYQLTRGDGRLRCGCATCASRRGRCSRCCGSRARARCDIVGMTGWILLVRIIQIWARR